MSTPPQSEQDPKGGTPFASSPFRGVQGGERPFASIHVPTDLEILTRIRGVFTPTWRERLLRWLCAGFFLGLCAPISFAAAASDFPPLPSRLPSVILTWMMLPFSIALGLYALFSGYPAYHFDGTSVRCLRGKRLLWEVALKDLQRVEAAEKQNDQTLHLFAPERELILNLYTPLHREWRLQKRAAYAEAGTH